MSNKKNHRRGGHKNKKRTETGPRYESPNPGAGCNATHVARARRDWSRIATRSERRTGATTSKYGGQRRVRPDPEEGEE